MGILGRITDLISFGSGFRNERDGYIYVDKGTTVPTDATAGYGIGCIFIHTDGGAGTAFYVNEGTENSCDFNAVAALTAAQEALISATAGTATASKAVILDSSGELPLGTIQLHAGMTPGTGISTGTGTVCNHRVTKVGDIIKTEILIDVTGLNDGGTAGDIIGKDGGTANCHIGRITAAVNGTILCGKITCFELPAGGDVDIDLWGSATEATGAQDAAISGLTGETQLVNHGDWSAEAVDYFSAIPAANGYLYLANGASTNADYTGGIFLIEMWGKAV